MPGHGHLEVVVIRSATLADLDQLEALETRCFDSDRLSRRSFRHMITQAHADLLVHETGNTLEGYALVLYHKGTHLARLYSIAVDTAARGRGLGKLLLQAAEGAALERGCITLRLEIRSDNHSAANLYRDAGYRQFGTYLDYYEDHADALRMEKSLARHLEPDMARVPYYRQTTEFTCGPAAIMMAMAAIDPELSLHRRLEFRLWREATTIFMTSGHGGCGPFGMALAAHHRGFGVKLWVNDRDALFLDSVRSEEKKEVIRVVHEDFSEEIEQAGIEVEYRPVTLEELKDEFDLGGIPVVLISSWRIYGERFPHWVVVTGFDERFVYVHDPYVDEEKGKNQLDSMSMPIQHEEFTGMARYGRSAQRAAMVLRPRAADSQTTPDKS
ncbi:MAG TPA: GNAT family N-acetyltransferase/peptidase C39 family protein [Gammaproteobacteria bacterium]